MINYHFIFSDRWRIRLYRHFLFWVFFILYLFIVKFYLADVKYLYEGKTYLIRLYNALLFLPPSMIGVYLSLAVLLPAAARKGSHWPILILSFLLILLLVLVSYMISGLLNIQLAWDIPLSRTRVVKRVDFAITNGLLIPITISGFAIMIKLAKNWYLKQMENERLIREKAIKELRLLKTQLQPQFLGQALSNIYDSINTDPGNSSDKLLRVSDLLSYILYESEEEEVLLDRELEILEAYILLEQENIDYEFSWDRTLSGNPEGTKIAPMILLPIVEFALENPNKNLDSFFCEQQVRVGEGSIDFVLTVTKRYYEAEYQLNGKTKLMNLEERLKELYAGRHELKIIRGEGSRTIRLTLSTIRHDNR